MNQTPAVSTACVQNSGTSGASGRSSSAASLNPAATARMKWKHTSALPPLAHHIRRLSGLRLTKTAHCAAQKATYATSRSTRPANESGSAKTPSYSTPLLASADAAPSTASPPANVMSVKSTRPRMPRPRSAIFPPRTPNDALANTGRLHRARMAGRVHAYTSGAAIRVPTPVLRPSCHQTSGASVLRFHRTNPNGTESTTAATARQTNAATDRSYSRGLDATKSSLMASAAPSRASCWVFVSSAAFSAATTASHAGSSSKNAAVTTRLATRGDVRVNIPNRAVERTLPARTVPSGTGRARTGLTARAVGSAPCLCARHAFHTRATGAITPSVDANIILAVVGDATS